jgi:hypothetical protein
VWQYSDSGLFFAIAENGNFLKFLLLLLLSVSLMPLKELANNEI